MLVELILMEPLALWHVSCLWSINMFIKNECEMTWHDVAWRNMTRHDLAWRGITWHNVTWGDMTWHSVAWHDITWHDNKVDNKVLVVWPSRDFRATAYKCWAFFCQGTNVWVTSKTSWTGRWPEFSRSLEQSSSVGMSSKDSLTSKHK